MPRTSWPLWLLSVAIPVAFPLLNFIYWPEVLRSGELPPDGDSIFIPMAASVGMALLMLPATLIPAVLCLSGYDPGTRFLTWRRDRPIRSGLLSVIFGIPAMMLVALIVTGFRFDMPWYEHLWTGYAILIVAWLICMRAAGIGRRTASGRVLELAMTTGRTGRGDSAPSEGRL